MAIFHLNAKIITRSKGQSSVRSAAYRRAGIFRDERLGMNFDYSNKKNVTHCEILIPANSPNWLQTLDDLQKGEPQKASEKFWNFVELKENRKDSELAREIEFALPLELTKERCVELAREYIKSQFNGIGMVADYSIHWEPNNPHVHVMLSTRELKEEGFGNKIRTWRDKSLLLTWRQSWAEFVNKYLAQEGFDIKIDHRSYAEQGIDINPTLHVGPGGHMSKSEIYSSNIKENKSIKLRNLENLNENPEIVLNRITQSNGTFIIDDINKIISKNLVTPNDGSNEKNPWRGDKKDIKQILNEISNKESVFTDSILKKASTKYSNQIEVINNIITQIKSSPEVIVIGPGDDGKERYTTRAMFKIECSLQSMADVLYKRNRHTVKTKIIDKAIKKFNLKNEQADSIRYILKSPDITAMVGRAGTGKSYSLKAACYAWKASGFKVHGIAIAGIASSNLQTDSGIESKTIASFCLALKEKRMTLSRKDVVVMDEAGMTDSISFQKVLSAVKTARAKLVLVGDDAQLQPVGPGAPFRALLERIGHSELNTIRRQKDSWQREATSKFAQGKIGKALDAYHRNRCIDILSNPNNAMEKLIDDWQLALNKKKESSLDQTLILAYRNIDVDALNLLARDRLVNQNSIDKGSVFKTIKGDIYVSIGERLIFLENNEQVGIKNGHRGTVTKIERNCITVKLDGKENETHIDTSKYNKFTYGYACTVHRSQGVTVDKSFVFAAGNWVRNLTYVAMSRHRKSVKLYANKETNKDFNSLKKSMSHQGIKDSVLDYPLAFAVRRGIDIDKIAEKVKTHILEKIREVKIRAKEFSQKVLNVKTHLAKNIQEQKFKQNPVDEFSSMLKQRSVLPAPWLNPTKDQKKEWRTITENMAVLSRTIINHNGLCKQAEERGILYEIQNSFTRNTLSHSYDSRGKNH